MSGGNLNIVLSFSYATFSSADDSQPLCFAKSSENDDFPPRNVGCVSAPIKKPRMSIITVKFPLSTFSLPTGLQAFLVQ